MSIRDTIFAADDIREEVVEVPEWGVDVRVRGLTLGQRNDALTESRGEDGVLSLSHYYALILIATVLEPESGNHVFLETDVDKILGKSSAPADNLAKKALSLSGLPEKGDVQAGVDAAGEDSSTTESDVPGI
jgi:hypothetical protein